MGLQEERLPIVAGVEDRLRLPDRLVSRVLSSPGNQLDLGAVGAHLHGLGRARRGGNQDLRFQAAGRRVGRDRGAAVAGTVLQQPRDALLAQRRNHHRGAAVLEAAGRGKPFELEERAARRPSDRSTSGVQPSPIVTGSSTETANDAAYRQSERVPDDVAAADARQRRDHQRQSVVRTPTRLGERVGPTATRFYVGRRGCRVLVFHFEIHRPSPWWPASAKLEVISFPHKALAGEGKSPPFDLVEAGHQGEPAELERARLWGALSRL